MLPENWIEHRRADGERVGWMVPDGELFRVVDLLGRLIDGEPTEWLEAEETLDELGIGYLADGYVLRFDDGRERTVRIAEVSVDRVIVVADDWGSASVIGSKPERFELPFPVPPTLRRRD